MKDKSTLFLLFIVIVLQLLFGCGYDESPESQSSPESAPTTTAAEETGFSTMPKGKNVIVDISSEEAAGELNERYAGFALDTAQITNGLWWSEEDRKNSAIAATPDLKSPKLIKLASYLAPSRLRIGGTACDGVYICPEEGECDLPAKYRDTFKSEGHIPTVLTREKVRLVADFAEAVDAKVMWCVSMGAGPRDEKTGAWTPDNAKGLLKYVSTLPNRNVFDIWEAGNEVNFLNVHQKLPVLLTLRRFGKDLKTFRAMVDTESPGNIVAAPGDYFLPFPFLGDLNFTKNLLKESLGEIDLLTWHLYATQSDRCPISPFPSTFEMLFSTAVINNSRKMAQYVKEASGGAVPVMNGESASCQCGGQTGVSDVMADALWWADWIGIMAEEGTSSIVRQTLVGSDYGMLDMDTFDPRPAFLVYVMHRRMAERLRLATDADRQEIKAHGYCSAETPGAVSAVLINPSAKTIVAGIGLKGNKIARAFQWTVSSGGDVNSKAASINGFRPLDDGTIPYPSGIPVHCENNRAYAKAAPYSVVFVDIVPVHAVALCQ